jgi:predicted Zn-dependent peptidase
VDHDWLVGVATDRFGDRPVQARHERSAPEPLVSSVTAVERDSEQVHLARAWRGVHHLDPDRYPLAVLNHVLGDGPSSRLFREIRDERGLAYSVFTSHSSSSDAGSVSLYCGTAPEHLEEVRALVDAELLSIRTEPVAADELEVAIGYLCGSMILGLEDHGARMSRLAASMTALGELIPVSDVISRIRAVTTDDIMAVADRIFGSAAVEVTVGPT